MFLSDQNIPFLLITSCCLWLCVTVPYESVLEDSFTTLFIAKLIKHLDLSFLLGKNQFLDPIKMFTRNQLLGLAGFLAAIFVAYQMVDIEISVRLRENKRYKSNTFNYDGNSYGDGKLDSLTLEIYSYSFL